MQSGGAAAEPSDVAGAAMMELSEDGQDWLVVLRKSFAQTIRWAGKPEKAQTQLEMARCGYRHGEALRALGKRREQQAVH